MPRRRVPRPPRLGLRRRLPQRAATRPTAPRTDLARLVDAAHAEGLAVVLDVVHNHLGASGVEAMEAFGPYLTDKYATPWGKAVNLDDAGSDPVREWILQSAERWIRDFHLDGLRLDAIHALMDSSPEHLVAALARRVHAMRPERAIVIAESGMNDPKVMRAPAHGGWGCDAAWADDFHHALRVALTGETDGWYEEFARPRHARQGLPPPARPRRHVLQLPRPPLRRARGRRPARALRRLLLRPRPGRQPRLRRPPARRGAPARRAAHVSGTVHAHALPGRGTRRGRAVPLLLRPHRPGDRRRRPGKAGAASSRRSRPSVRKSPIPRTR